MKAEKKVKISLIILFMFSFICVNSCLAATGTVTGTDSSVRIRKNASSNSEVISVATKGEKVEVIGEENGWYKINFENITGYISKEFVDTAYSSENTSATTAVESNESDSNNNDSTVEENVVEETPSAPENGTDGVEETVQDDNNNNNNNEVMTTENDTTTNEEIVGKTIVLENEVSLRYMPNFYSRISNNLSSSVSITVSDELNKWVKISDNNVTGWVLKDEIKGLVQNNTDTVNNATQENNSPSEPDPNTQSTTENNNLPNSDTPSTATDTASAVKTGHINVESARLRAKPDGTVVEILDLNTKLEIVGEEGDWYKVNVGNNKNCYVAKRIVTVE